VYFDTSI